MSDLKPVPMVNAEGWASSLSLTRAYMRDPLRVMRDVHSRHGPVAQMNLFGMKAIVLLGAEANERVLLNRDGAFSSEAGWSPVIGRTFPDGLISLDGVRHRQDRRLIGAAFKPAPMQQYLAAMGARFGDDVRRWPERLRFYPTIKRLTLESASRDLLGLPLGPEASRVSRAFSRMLGASAAMIRHPVPGGAVWRGVRARAWLSRFLTTLIPERRRTPGPDLFSSLCSLPDDDGTLSETAIVDHVNLLLMAAHDTTTSALTSIAYFLGRYPDWQDAVRDELLAWRSGSDAPDYEGLRSLVRTDMVLQEALRCMPPVVSLPRGVVKDVEFAGCRIPAGSSVGIHILHTHYLEAHWPEPERFDPLRFTPDRSGRRHKHAWLPFGGGVHTCLGLHFAGMQVKLFLSELLRDRRIVLDADYTLEMQWLPISRPKDGLPLSLVRR